MFVDLSGHPDIANFNDRTLNLDPDDTRAPFPAAFLAHEAFARGRNFLKILKISDVSDTDEDDAHTNEDDQDTPPPGVHTARPPPPPPPTQPSPPTARIPQGTCPPSTTREDNRYQRQVLTVDIVHSYDDVIGKVHNSLSLVEWWSCWEVL